MRTFVQGFSGFFLLLALAAAPALVRAESRVQVVPGMDLSRYAGSWYEIARFPNRFQKRCISDVVANYVLQPGGTMGVVNKCRQADGSYKEAQAQARLADPAQPNTKLEVRFAPSWLSWLPWVWGDYWVIALDADYRYSLVGTPDHDYLWILARTPTLDAAVYEHLLAQAKAQGFDITRLKKTGQGQ